MQDLTPFLYTDPSGYLFKSLAKFAGFMAGGVSGAYASHQLHKWVAGSQTLSALGGAVVGTVISAFCGPCSIGFSALYSSTIASYNGASTSGALKAGATTAATAAVFYGIGRAFNETSGFWETNGPAHIAAHAVAGGVIADLQGGKFGHGFISAGLTKAANVNGMIPDYGTGYDIARIVVAATIGGTVSKLTGGKFANGATTAAFAQAFNGNSQIKKQIPISQQEREYLAMKSKEGVIKFYKSRQARGDGYAELALDVVEGKGSLGRMANAQLALEVMTTYSDSGRTLPNYENFMESVNIGLAEMHADYVTSDFLNDSTGVGGLLNKYQIQQYHEVYFESIGLSKHTFGGATFGINNNFIFNWCNGCDQN